MNKFMLRALVEIPLGSMYKYEVDKNTNKLVVDRPLPSPITYNYGYIPNTLHNDGDPTDVCIVGDTPIYPLTSVNVYVVGAFRCIDNGSVDDKLVAVVLGDNMPEFKIELGKKKIEHYLSTYKKGFIVKGFVDADQAAVIINRDWERFGASHGL